MESSDEDSDQDLVRNNGNPVVIDNQQQQLEQNLNQGNNFESAPLTLDPSGKWYWDFQLQQWFPVTLDPTLRLLLELSTPVLECLQSFTV